MWTLMRDACCYGFGAFLASTLFLSAQWAIAPIVAAVTTGALATTLHAVIPGIIAWRVSKAIITAL